MTKSARAFIKWVGGKATLVETLASLLPEKIETYYEPFVGGGSLFWHLAAQGRFQKAVLNDVNVELVGAYRVIRDNPHELISLLHDHKRRYLERPEEYYYEVRAKDSTEGTAEEQAARFMFLNRTGFNGLYRVNKKGGFNVPWGKYKNPNICNEENILACSKALAPVFLEIRDFSLVVGAAQAGDAVYFDPPYVPLTATANFTSYTQSGFTLDDQYRLAACVRELVEKGVHTLVSNSDTDIVRDLYTNYELKSVEMRRNINSKGGKRGPVGEVVVLGYPKDFRWPRVVLP